MVEELILSIILKAQQSLQRLDEIALKLNPLARTEFLELLIESEKNEAKLGWKKRVQYYGKAKLQAEILSEGKDLITAKKRIKEETSKGDKRFSRFTFW